MELTCPAPTSAGWSGWSRICAAHAWNVFHPTTGSRRHIFSWPKSRIQSWIGQASRGHPLRAGRLAMILWRCCTGRHGNSSSRNDWRRLARTGRRPENKKSGVPPSSTLSHRHGVPTAPGGQHLCLRASPCEPGRSASRSAPSARGRPHPGRTFMPRASAPAADNGAAGALAFRRHGEIAAALVDRRLWWVLRLGVASGRWLGGLRRCCREDKRMAAWLRSAQSTNFARI